MTFQKVYFGLLAASVSALALSGCSHPHAMPSGYTYHYETYKSATPPPSPKVTKEQRQYMDSTQAEQFRDAVYNLLERLTHRAGMPPKPIYILAPDPMTTFYANIDNDLRESMRHIGYALSDIPTGAYVFVYSARLLERPRGSISAGEPNVELVLRVFDAVGKEARMLTEESGNYFIKGAELLHIKPSQYSILPSREKIIRQAEEHEPSAEPRTVTEFSSDPTSATVQPVSPPEPQISAPATTAYDGPMQAVTIDSSGVSYSEPPMLHDRPAMPPRSSVSKKMDYY